MRIGDRTPTDQLGQTTSPSPRTTSSTRRRVKHCHGRTRTATGSAEIRDAYCSRRLGSSAECLFKLAPCRTATFRDTAQNPFKFLTRCLHLKKYINPNLDLLIDQDLLRTGLPGASEQVKYYQDKTELYTAADKLVAELKDQASLTVTEEHWDWTREFVSRPAGAGPGEQAGKADSSPGQQQEYGSELTCT